MNFNFTTIQNILISITSLVMLFGLLILYFNIWQVSKKIKNINKQIENKQQELEKIKLKNIKSDYDLNIDLSDNKQEKQNIQEIKNEFEALKRHKQYLLELISIYKIFKK